MPYLIITLSENQPRTTIFVVCEPIVNMCAPKIGDKDKKTNMKERGSQRLHKLAMQTQKDIATRKAYSYTEK